LPDILILHLKRFNFDGGYLDKIEDLVTFPIRNLDMQKYVIDGMKQSTIFDLYAVVNHHIYQTGGHYTAVVQVKTQSEPIWVLTNDSTIT
jgi:ubiquitin C-terminal hydrolase